MIIAIISIAVGILLFLISFLGFRAGLRLGMNTAKGIIPPKIDPLKKANKSVETPQQNSFVDKLIQGHANMMAFDGEVKDGDK